MFWDMLLASFWYFYFFHLVLVFLLLTFSIYLPAGIVEVNSQTVEVAIILKSIVNAHNVIIVKL